MDFLHACAMAVITVLVVVAVGVVAWFLSWISDEEDAWPFFAYLISGMGFGACLALLLIRNGAFA